MEKITELNYFYSKYAKSEDSVKDLRRLLVFARAHLCSSILLEWVQTERKKFLFENGKEGHYKKAYELLSSHPDSIDGYYVKNFGSGSMNHVTEKRAKATEKNFEELIGLIEKSEKFIKEELEKGTKYEGEFDKRIPRAFENEERAWEFYKIKQEIKKEES